MFGSTQILTGEKEQQETNDFEENENQMLPKMSFLNLSNIEWSALNQIHTNI